MKLAHNQHQRKLKEQNRIPAGWVLREVVGGAWWGVGELGVVSLVVGPLGPKSSVCWKDKELGILVGLWLPRKGIET